MRIKSTTAKALLYSVLAFGAASETFSVYSNETHHLSGSASVTLIVFSGIITLALTGVAISYWIKGVKQP